MASKIIQEQTVHLVANGDASGRVQIANADFLARGASGFIFSSRYDPLPIKVSVIDGNWITIVNPNGSALDATKFTVATHAQILFNGQVVDVSAPVEGTGDANALLIDDPVVGATMSLTYTAGKLTAENWYNPSTSNLMKAISYTYSGNLPITEVVRIYASDGVTIVAQTTSTYGYTQGQLSSTTKVRDI